MSKVKEAPATASQQEEVAASSLLDQAIGLTKQTQENHAVQLFDTLVSSATKGMVTWNKTLSRSIQDAIQKIDELLSKQVTEILHQEKLQKLEGSWRGLCYLVKNSLINSDLKIKVLNVDKKALAKNLDKAMEFDQSDVFKKIYEAEYGTPGGSPFGALIGDYAIGNTAPDINFIQNMSETAAAAFCPFIASAAPSLCGVDTYEELSKPRDLSKIFESPEYTKWNGYRNTEDSRFVTLTMPRVLARLPYSETDNPVEAFEYNEIPQNESGKAIKVPHENYCWMNASYVLGARLTNAFSEFGWCTAIRGAENGGKVNGLPAHTFVSDDGDLDMKCPTEIGITDRREAELSKMGFLPLSHYKNTDYAVFFGAQTTQKPKQYDDPDATANSEISARLPYLMATSRIAHYLKVISRDKIGSFMETKDVEEWLNKWVLDYVNSNASSGPMLKAKFPLADAKIQVKPVVGKPGAYQAVAWLRPWLQLEELSTSLRLVANIPEKG